MGEYEAVQREAYAASTSANAIKLNRGALEEAFLWGFLSMAAEQTQKSGW